MKRLITWGITAFCFSLYAMSQKISPVITLQNGREVNSEYAILERDTCTFCANMDEAYNWSFALFERKPDALVQVLQTNERVKEFTIHPDLIDWTYAKRYEEEGDSSVYFKGMVYLWEGQEKKDSLVVRFNLLPSRLDIIEASFTYSEFDWEYDDFNLKAVLTIVGSAARGNSYSLWCGDSFCFSFPEHYFFRYGCIPNVYENEAGKVSLEYNHADWGEFYIVSTHNKYGTVYGVDTLFTTDYISDPKILARLEELEKEYHAVSSIPNEYDIRIINKNDHIEINGNKSLVQGLFIYDSTGKLIKMQRGGENMDISKLSQGLYIVSCRTTDNQILTTKIMKR